MRTKNNVCFLLWCHVLASSNGNGEIKAYAERESVPATSSQPSPPPPLLSIQRSFRSMERNIYAASASPSTDADDDEPSSPKSKGGSSSASLSATGKRRGPGVGFSAQRRRCARVNLRFAEGIGVVIIVLEVRCY